MLNIKNAYLQKNLSLKTRAFILFNLLVILPNLTQAGDSDKHILSKHGVVAYTWNANASAEKSIRSKSLYTFNNGRAVTRAMGIDREGFRK